MTHDVELGFDRVLKPGKLAWLRALGWMFGLIVAVILAFSLFSAGGYLIGALVTGVPIERMTEDVPGVVHLIAMAVGSAAGVLAYWGLVQAGENRLPSELALRPAATELLIGLGIGAAMMAVAVGIMVAAGWARIDGSPLQQVWRAAAMSIESGVMEELIFRGIILRLLWRAFGIWPALAVSAALFGVVHITNPNSSLFAALCIVVEAGIMLAAFYILTGRLWVSIGVHAGWNFTQGWIFGAAVSGTDFFAGGPLDLEPAEGVPAWLSGAGFGPEASLAGLLVGTLAGLIVLWLAWKRGRFAAGTSASGTIAATAP